MKLLTFLGTGNYQSTTYVWDGKECTTEFAPVASCHFLQPQQLIIFVTSDARGTHLGKLTSQLPEGVSVVARDIPTGQDEKELWEIFSAVAGTVSPKEEVAFDITHGLRSFPSSGCLPQPSYGVDSTLKCRQSSMGVMMCGINQRTAPPCLISPQC